MKIVVKQIDELKGSNGKIVAEYLVYLMGPNERPLSCEIVYGKAAKNDLVGDMLIEHFMPTDWENNKATFDVSNIVEELSYEGYLKLSKEAV